MKRPRMFVVLILVPTPALASRAIGAGEGGGVGFSLLIEIAFRKSWGPMIPELECYETCRLRSQYDT